MDHPHPLADPILDRAVGHKLQEFVATHRPQASAGSAIVRAELDRYDIAVVSQAVYEWGGYRFTNAMDPIAAARRTHR